MPSAPTNSAGTSASSSTGGRTHIKEKAVKDDTNKAIAGKKGGSPKEKGVSPPGPGQTASKIILTGLAVSTDNTTKKLILYNW